MPPLTSPDRHWSPASWRILLLMACVLVFAYALHAKVAVYHQSSQPQTSTSEKLWLNVEKMNPQPIAPGVVVLWFAAFVVCLFREHIASRHEDVYGVPALARARQYYLHRFLRPPPAR